MSDPTDDAQLDGCDVDMTRPDQLTEDGEQTDALVMFADCWDDPAAVEQRRRDLIALDTPPADTEPTTGAPHA
jgi:hypothetical protein